MTTKRTNLFQLFKTNTGKTMHQPKPEPDMLKLVGYQVPRCDRIRYQGNNHD